MRYIWINPVTESMYEEPVMEEFLTKHGFTRVRCMVDWGQAVKEKYREMLDGCRDTVADARCPMACGLVEALTVRQRDLFHIGRDIPLFQGSVFNPAKGSHKISKRLSCSFTGYYIK